MNLPFTTLARWLFFATLLAYVVVALKPFDWQPPHFIHNGVQFFPDEELRFPTPGLARTSHSPEWVAAAAKANNFQIRLTLRTFDTDQSGPARIFSVSRDEDARNVTIAQERSDLIVRLRRGTAYNGKPEYVIPAVLSDLKWHRLELIVQTSSVTIRWDGTTVLDRSLPPDPLAHWNARYPLVLGNELSGNRPWLGAIALATAETGAAQWNCLNSPGIEIPNRYLSGELLVPLAGPLLTREAFGDVLLNLICFVPLGYFFAMGYRGVSILLAVSLCALLSLSIEFAQIFFGGRYTSLSDLAANTLGGGIGILLARSGWFRGQPERRPAR